MEEAAQHFGVRPEDMRMHLAESLQVSPPHGDGPAISKSVEEVVTELDEYLDLAWGHSKPIASPAPQIAESNSTHSKPINVRVVWPSLPLTTYREGVDSADPRGCDDAWIKSMCDSGMEALGFVGFGAGILVTLLLLLRRQPRFAPANVELLQSMTAKAAM